VRYAQFVLVFVLVLMLPWVLRKLYGLLPHKRRAARMAAVTREMHEFGD
jgi:hypothetical protein